MGIEIERKFLIHYPDISALMAEPNCACTEIWQTYLSGEASVTERVRKRGWAGVYRYWHTLKRRLTALSCEEDEREIDQTTYETLLTRADPSRKTIYKTRYVLPYRGQTLEIDVYPFWTDRAIMEIELTNEAQTIEWPPFIELIRDVSDDPRYKNYRLAQCIPFE